MIMDETINIAKTLRDSPDLFPWVLLCVVLVIIFKERGTIKAYFNARIEAHEAKKEYDVLIAELIRNNTAALENNTAALESVKADRGETRRMLTYHEEMSKERMTHIQTVVNRIDETVSQNEKDISIIKDRDR